MGGILGKLSFERDEPLARPVLEQMLGALRHPDGPGGMHVATGVALGWSGAEASAFTSDATDPVIDHRLWVVAAGNVTNAAVVRRQLVDLGQPVATDAAASLIAHAYVAWGDACLEHLRGTFTCAIWDHSRHRLLLARDPLGTRPLFFALLHGHGVVFASEIRALLQDPGVGREWCPQAIDAYLALGYVPAPLTIYRRISKVEPGQRLIVEGRRLHVDPYWDLPRHTVEAPVDTIVDALEERLRVSVANSLEDGSTTTVLYSGGVASSALLTALPRRDVSTIRVRTADDDGDELRAQAAARRLGFDPIVTSSAALDIRTIALDMVAQLDEPVADPAAVSQYSAFVTARPYTGAALAGHGASLLWRTGSDLANTDAAFRSPHLWDSSHRREVYTRAFAWQVGSADPFGQYVEPADVREIDPLARARYVAAHNVLPDRTLALAQQAAAAADLRLHFPFLDFDLVQLAASWVPAGARRSWWRPAGSAAINPLHALVARRLPFSLLPRAISRPAHAWLGPALAAMVPGFLLGGRFDTRGIVSRPSLQRLWDEHCAGRRDHSHRFWSLLMLEFWFREFIDGDAVDEPFEYAVLRAA